MKATMGPGKHFRGALYGMVGAGWNTECDNGPQMSRDLQKLPPYPFSMGLQNSS